MDRSADPIRSAPAWGWRNAVAAFVAAVIGAIAVPAALAQPLPGPNFTAPTADTMRNNLAASWQAVPGAGYYEVCVREELLGSCVLERKPHTGSSFNEAMPAALRGKRLYFNVKACRPAGVDCGLYSSRSFYAMATPVLLDTPADGATHPGADRRPTFRWQAHTGFAATSQPASLRYKLTISAPAAPGAPSTTIDNLAGTTYTPPAGLPASYGNQLRWGVQACTPVNCSSPGASRTLDLAGATAPAWGPVQPSQPASGATVDTGAKLVWLPLNNAASYRVCLHTQATGCRLLLDVAASAGPQLELTSAILDMKEGPTSPAYVFRSPAGSPTLKTMFWSVDACTAGNTQCTSPATTPQKRQVFVANAPVAPNPGGGNSFSQLLLPAYQHARCINCHGVNASPSTKPSHNVGSTCSGCHNQGGATNWHAPAASFDLRNRTAAQLCQMTKAFANFAHHLKNDTLIIWAVDSGQLPPTNPPLSPLATAPPQSATAWRQRVDTWVAAGAPCP